MAGRTGRCRGKGHREVNISADMQKMYRDLLVRNAMGGPGFVWKGCYFTEQSIGGLQFEKETYFSRRTDRTSCGQPETCGSGLSSQEMQNMEKYAKAAGQSFEYSSLNHITDVKVAVPSGGRLAEIIEERQGNWKYRSQ